MVSGRGQGFQPRSWLSLKAKHLVLSSASIFGMHSLDLKAWGIADVIYLFFFILRLVCFLERGQGSFCEKWSPWVFVGWEKCHEMCVQGMFKIIRGEGIKPVPPELFCFSSFLGNQEVRSSAIHHCNTITPFLPSSLSAFLLSTFCPNMKTELDICSKQKGNSVASRCL